MNSECLKEIFFLAILLLNNIVMSMQEDQVCTLPDGETDSTCVPLPQCKTLQDIVDKYNRTLPNDELDYLRKHYCGRNNDVCCPNVEYVPRIATLPETVEEENGICTLPNSNRKSKCVFFDECNHFRNIVNTQLLTEDIIKDINMHSCKERGNVCCPDYIDDIFTTSTEATTTTTTEMVMIPGELLAPLNPKNVPNKTDLNWLQNHRHFSLINDKTCGASGVNRVLNGFDAEMNEMPWAVLLGYVASRDLDGLTEWKCGGSLISSRFVLSAAHCINRFLKFARLGEHQISTEQDCDDDGDCADPVQDINISKKIPHPQYDISKRINDIALLKLATPADISKTNVRTICLPVHEKVDFDVVSKANRYFTIAGWGSMNNGKPNADVLQKAFLPYENHNECIRKYIPHPEIAIYQSFICAGGYNKTDACYGDSGGSFSKLSVIPNSSAKIYLYGIVLGGVDCALEYVTLPGIFTDVRYYFDWILDNMSFF